jgi:nucleotide-binding universal stress UspA family protein
MSEPAKVPFVESIFHPTDFSAGSENAFAHALAIALLRQAKLTLLHVGTDFLGEDEWTKFPPVRATLTRWGLLEEGSPRSAIFDRFGVEVRKVNVRSLSPLAACLEYLDDHATDLLVVSTEGREGLPRWLKPSVSQRLSRRAGTVTLFVPRSSAGFVSPKDGRITLRRILLPIDESPSPHEALTYASRTAMAMGEHPVRISLLHAGDATEMPTLELRDQPAYTWETVQRPGDAVDEILQVAGSSAADLIVMTTAGRDDFLDALRGSVTEQVVRRAPCPILAVPAR